VYPFLRPVGACRFITRVRPKGKAIVNRSQGKTPSSDPPTDFDCADPIHALEGQTGNRMSASEIARRLSIGRLAVYALLEQGIIPGIRLGRRWIITRHAYERWERTCGMRSGAGLRPTQEVTVLN
jgi:excisionase family DNA binding protein